MKTHLSVNLNKVALVRNTRHLGIPSVTRAATLCLEAGAAGITVHPRPDARHIRAQDVLDLAELLKAWPDREFNVEGNPFHNLMDCVRDLRERGLPVHQVTAAMAAAKAVGADRIELYTEPFAAAWGTADQQEQLDRFAAAAQAALDAGLGVNAGHDLNRDNLTAFAQQVPGLQEVSIGHALIADALELGYTATIQAYLACLGQ